MNRYIFVFFKLRVVGCCLIDAGCILARYILLSFPYFLGCFLITVPACEMVAVCRACHRSFCGSCRWRKCLACTVNASSRQRHVVNGYLVVFREVSIIGGSVYPCLTVLLGRNELRICSNNCSVFICPVRKVVAC